MDDEGCITDRENDLALYKTSSLLMRMEIT